MIVSSYHYMASILYCLFYKASILSFTDCVWTFTANTFLRAEKTSTTSSSLRMCWDTHGNISGFKSFPGESVPRMICLRVVIFKTYVNHGIWYGTDFDLGQGWVYRIEKLSNADIARVNEKPKKFKTVWHGVRGILKMSGRVNQASLKLSAGFSNTVCWTS